VRKEEEVERHVVVVMRVTLANSLTFLAVNFNGNITVKLPMTQ